MSSSYSDKLCEALIVVLDHCSRMEPRRLAGYAANIDFWVGEIQHRLRLVEELVERRRRMVAGTKEFYGAEILRSAAAQDHDIQSAIEPDARDVSTDWESLQSQSKQLRDRVAVSAKIFLHRCRMTGLVTVEKLAEIEARLKIKVGAKS